MKNKPKDNSTIVGNDALRGKPYLDIDRVITKSRSENFSKEK